MPHAHPCSPRPWLPPLALPLLLLSMVAAGPALAQGRKTPVAETALSSCVAANRQALLDLTQATQASLRRHVTNPVVVTRLQALQGQLLKLRDGLPRATRTLPECEQAGEAVAAEKDRLLKIAGPDPEVADCMANNQKLQAAVTQGYEAVQRSGRLPADQAAAFEGSGARLNQISAALARDSMLAADCRQIGELMAQERTRVEGWLGSVGITLAAAPPQAPAAAAATLPAAAAAVPAAAAARPAVPGAGAVPLAAASPAATAATGTAAAAGTVAAPAAAVESAQAAQACRDNHARTYNDLAQAMATVGQDPPLAPDKQLQFQSLIERLTRLRGLIADRNGPGWDCGQVGQGLEQVRLELQPLLPKSR